MHHISLRQGLRWFSAKRRRTVSRDRSVCSVSWTIAPANNSRVQRARPSGRVEQAVATRSASSLPVSLRARRVEVLLIANAGVGSQQDLRTFKLTRGVHAAGQQRGELVAFGW